jgi:hypothetical protein
MASDSIDVAVPGAGSIIGLPFDSLIVDTVEERNVLGELPRYFVKLREIAKAAKTLQQDEKSNPEAGALRDRVCRFDLTGGRSED